MNALAKHLATLTDAQLAKEVKSLTPDGLIEASRAAEEWFATARERRAIVNGERKRRDLEAQGAVIERQIADMLDNLTPEQIDRLMAQHQRVDATPAPGGD